jgi:hypothetical protein
VMKYRKEWSHSKCPRCETPIETTSHVWTCQHPEVKEIWSNAMDDLRTWLLSKRTNMAVTDAIIDRLLAWQSGEPPPPLQSRLLGLAAAIAEQDDIGWNSAFEGRWSTKWIEIQERHFKNSHLRRSGLRWLSALIRKLWLTSWDLWDHRNGVNQEVLKVARRAANRPIIVEEYELGRNGLAGYDRCLFNKHLVHRLADDLDKQDAWIRRVQAARHRASVSEPVRIQAARINLRATLRRLGHGMPQDQLQESTDTDAPTLAE